MPRPSGLPRSATVFVRDSGRGGDVSFLLLPVERFAVPRLPLGTSCLHRCPTPKCPGNLAAGRWFPSRDTDDI